MMYWLLTHIQEVSVLVFGIFGFLMLRSNKHLKELNKDLDKQLQDTTKIIDIQQKVIDVTENTKPSDFDGNIKRMQDGKL